MNFLKNVLASCLGSLLFIFGMGLLVAVGMRGCGSDTPTVKPNSILTLTLNDAMPELSNNTEGGGFPGGDLSELFQEKVGLNDAIALLEKAKSDEQIKGVFLNLDMGSAAMGFASLKKIREKLLELREAKKFVIAYANIYNRRAYYLASAADKIYMNPQGGLDFTGFAAQLIYFKGMLDKLGVKAQVYYAGKFKSATEPFRRTNMSEENRLQVREYLEGYYNIYLQHISKSRNIEVAKLRALADSMNIRQPQDAVTHKLIDGLKYRDEVLSEIRERLGIEADKTIPSINLSDYLAANKSKLHTQDNAEQVVAVVVAEGDIVDGEGENGNIGGEFYAREIRKLRQNKSIKAIVLRVNSGGGSALASELIWRELEQAKAQGIHVVASMGDVAASGGYYIATGAEKIFAEDNTITGSIGVFGLIPNYRELFEQKMGLTMDTVRTTRYSAMDGGFYEFAPRESAFVQEQVDRLYLTFKERVAKARKMPIDRVDSVAQGRVWIGAKAKDIGLVDELGGTQEAIQAAAKLSNLSSYSVVYYPARKGGLELVFSLDKDEEDGGKNSRSQLQELWLRNQTGQFYPLVQEARRLQGMQGPQMRLPYLLQIQ